MADKPRRRPAIDPAIADLLASDRRTPPPEEKKPEPPPSPQSRKQQRQEERRARRATFDLPPVVRQRLAELSVDYGVPQSQLVALLLLRGFEAMEAGEIDPAPLRERSTSPRFAYNLDLTPWLERLKNES